MEHADGKMLAEIKDGIGFITFNNPEKRNAVNSAMSAALAEILEAYDNDPAVRVVVLAGAGDKSFVAGADLGEIDRGAAQGVAPTAVVANGRDRLARFNKPVIAQIQGFCIGGGLGIALLADLRIAAEEAQFGVPVAKLGNAYGEETIGRMIELIGPSNTRMMLYTADRIDGRQAERWGLVNRCVTAGELAETVRGVAATIAGNAPLTLKASKLTVTELVKEAALQDRAAMTGAIEFAKASEDFKEGRRAFLEKRKPVFKGV